MAIAKDEILNFLKMQYKKEIAFAEKYKGQAKDFEGDQKEALLAIAQDEEHHAQIVQDMINRIESELITFEQNKDVQGKR